MFRVPPEHVGACCLYYKLFRESKQSKHTLMWSHLYVLSGSLDSRHVSTVSIQQEHVCAL